MQKQLPPRYYLTNFFEFLDFFKGPSHDLLRETDKVFIDAFDNLSEDCQCIIARACYRTHSVLRVDSFYYDEIPTPIELLMALKNEGWFLDLGSAASGDILKVLPKPDLLQVLSLYESISGLKSKKKEVIVGHLEAQLAGQSWLPSDVDDKYVVFGGFNTLQYLMFLYFGHLKGKLSQFSMRDLGVMRTRKDAVMHQSRFESLHDAQAAYFFALQLDAIKRDNWPGIERTHLNGFATTNCPAANRFKEKFLYKAGCKLLLSEPSLALELLGECSSAEATEKWVRETYKQGRHELVKDKLEAIIDDPETDTLLLFAEDFYARKFNKKKTSTLTDMLRGASRKLQLDQSYSHHVEQGVIYAYARRGVEAHHVENTLWRVLFALTFWELLFEKDGVVSQFDRRPISLQHDNFYEKFEPDIVSLLDALHGPTELFALLTGAAGRHYGKVNSLFMWHPNVLSAPQVLLKHSKYSHVKNMLLAMTKHYRHLKDGFPDLMVIEDGRLRFEEIKSTGDQIRRNQLHTINTLKKNGFDVGISQVEWIRDPNQTYVVVDIETTGGASQYHRITEIGAVKIVAGEVIDTWQSLINPQRRIPQAITRLTGINNAMVADAPVFEDIAEEFQAFLEGSVFVAHNVNFDYGFLKQEYARLDLRFSYPKLCTVREMRKAYPGLSSYSLASLTGHFDIAMTQHHRALSDAQAAAELLVLSQK